MLFRTQGILNPDTDFKARTSKESKYAQKCWKEGQLLGSEKKGEEVEWEWLEKKKAQV